MPRKFQIVGCVFGAVRVALGEFSGPGWAGFTGRRGHKVGCYRGSGPGCTIVVFSYNSLTSLSLFRKAGEFKSYRIIKGSPCNFEK